MPYMGRLFFLRSSIEVTRIERDYGLTQNKQLGLIVKDIRNY